jgi:hypothetical protein
MNRKPTTLFTVDAALVPAAGPKPRRRPRLEEEMPFELFAEALGWVHKRLRIRQGRELSEIAKHAHVGERTLRDLEQQKHLNTALAPYAYAYALGYHPDRVALITRRWLRKYLRRVQPQRIMGGYWEPPFPWLQKTCQTQCELSQFPK